MAAKIHNVDSYYQTFIKNGLHILPYIIAMIFFIQLVIQKIKFYLNAQWNQFIGFIVLLLNCTIEDEDELENSLNSREGAHRENINSDLYNTIDYETNNESGHSSSSNTICSTQDFNDSVSDIEILRGEDDDETNNKKIRTIAEEIDAKTVILQNKRHDLCGRLLAYKLMEFQIDVPLHGASNSSNVPKTDPRPKSPLPVAEEIDFKVPSTPAYHPQPPPFLPEYEESYGLTCDEMFQRAIQASLDDVAANMTVDSNLTPPRGNSSFAKLPGESSGSPHSTGKITQNQSTPPRIIENKPHLQSPVVNLLAKWNKDFTYDVEKPDVPVADVRQEDNSENVVMEDFMVGDRYVGDKGKRPMSGRYAYKKRSKPSSKSDAEEPGPSGGTDVLKESAAE